jgi:hypothetical protein
MEVADRLLDMAAVEGLADHHLDMAAAEGLADHHLDMAAAEGLAGHHRVTVEVAGLAGHHRVTVEVAPLGVSEAWAELAAWELVVAWVLEVGRYKRRFLESCLRQSTSLFGFMTLRPSPIGFTDTECGC